LSASHCFACSISAANRIRAAACRTRRFSDPNRSVPPQFVEYRDRNSHRVFGLTVKQQLG
jgi:hypothetical protein